MLNMVLHPAAVRVVASFIWVQGSPRPRFVPLITLALLATMAPPAMARNDPPPRTFDQVQVEQFPNDPPPKTFGQVRLGPVYITPWVGVGNIGVDTNVYNTSLDRQQAFTFTLFGGAGIDVIGRNLRVQSTVGTGYVYYSTGYQGVSVRPSQGFGSEQGRQGLNPGLLQLNAEYRLVPRLVLFSTNNRFAYADDRPNFEIDTRARRLELNTGLGARYLLTPRLSLSVEVRFYRVRFDEDAAYLGVQLASSLNQRRFDQRGELRYQLTPLTELYLPAWWQQNQFDSQVGRNGGWSGAGGGVRFRPPGLLAGEVEVGRRASQTLQHSVPSQSGPYARTSVRLTLGDTIRINLGSQRNTAHSYEVTRVYSVYWWHQASLTQRLGQRFEAGPYFQYYEQRDPASSGTLDTIRTSGASLAYVVHQSRYEVFAEYWDRQSYQGLDRLYNRWHLGFRIRTSRARGEGDYRGTFWNGGMGLGDVRHQ